MEAWYLLLSYVIGAIPVGILLARISGLSDPRTYGSLNPGATNIARQNKLMGIITFFAEGLKVMFMLWMVPETWQLWGWLALIFGQTCSIFLGGQGGKGVACFVWGWGLLFPHTLIIPCTLALVLYAFSKQMWLVSVSLLLFFLFFIETSFFLKALMIPWLIWRHRSNLQGFCSFMPV